MAIIDTLKNKLGEILYPRTKIEAVDGLTDSLDALEGEIAELQNAQDITTTDSTTLENSHAGRVKINEIVGGMEQDSTEGNQLADFSDMSETVGNGITWSCENGVIKAIGTSTVDNASSQNVSLEAHIPIVAGTYYVSGTVSGVTVYVKVKDTEGTVLYYKDTSFTLDGTETLCTVFCQCGASGSVVNATVYPLVSTDENATWEPYTNGASPNPDYPQEIEGTVISEVKTHGKNFFEVTATSNDIFTVNSDNSVTAKGTATGDFFRLGNVVLPKGDYIASGCPSHGTSSTFNIRVGNITNGNTYIGNDTGKGVYFSITEPTEVQLRINFVNGIVFSDEVFYPMIREASIEDATYEPYQSHEITLSNPITLYNDVLGENVERKYAVIAVDSNTLLYVHPYSTDERLVFYYRVYRAGENPKVLCTHLPTITYSELLKTQDCVYIEAGGSTIISLPITLTPTIEDARAWLIDNGVKFVQSLEEPTTEELPTADRIALNSLPTYDGVTYVEFVDVGVMPSVSLDYGTSKIGGMTLEGLLAGINGELQSQLNNDRITALESAVVNNV